MIKFNISNLDWREYNIVDSTINTAQSIISNEEVSKGLVIIANSQDSGRGSGSNKWQSPEGNLYTTTILNNNYLNYYCIKYEQLYLISILSTANIVLDYCNDDIQRLIKWPNDIYVNNQKASGLLLHKEDSYTLLSIGLNINNAPAGFYQLNNTNKVLSVKDIMKKILYYMSFYAQKTLKELMVIYTKKMLNYNTFITVKNKLHSYSGIIKGINSKMELLVESETGVYTVNNKLFITNC